MLGRHVGWVPFVGEVLGTRLAAEGYAVVSTSHRRNRLVRFADIATTLVRHRRDIDVQILQVYSGPSFVVEDLASWLGGLFGHKVIMHIHGGAMREFIARYPKWTSRVLSRATAIVTPSAFLHRALAPLDLCVHVIPNAVDVTCYPYRQRETLRPRLFWMRTFHTVYNPELAIKVLVRVRHIYPNATLVMAGQEKGTQASVRQLARTLGVDDAIRFPGFLDAEAKIREADRADIFLNTNHVDNMPVSIIEAGAMGLPVIATNVGGISDLLTDGETGLLVPDDDDDAMAAAVIRLLRDPALARRLSAAGRGMAERLSWDQTLRQWKHLINLVVESSPALNQVSPVS